MHPLKFLRRRFPTSYTGVLVMLGLLLLALVVIGFGLLFVR